MKSEEVKVVLDKVREALTAVERLYETATRQEAEFRKLVSEQPILKAQWKANNLGGSVPDWQAEIRKANPQFVTPDEDYQEKVMKKLKEMFPSEREEKDGKPQE